MKEHKIQSNDRFLRQIKSYDYLFFYDKELDLKNIFIVTKVDTEAVHYLSLVGGEINIREFVNFEDGSWGLLLISDTVREKLSLPKREDC
jgi:hypothetical protein